MASNWKLTNRVWHANLGMLSAVTLGVIALSCPFIAHKWEAGKVLMDIHYGRFLPPQTRWIWIDGQGFLLAFLIVSGLLMHRKSVKKAASTAADDPAVAGSSVTILGLGDDAPALAFAKAAQERGLRAFRPQAEALEKLDLTHERWLVLTHAGNLQEARAVALAKRVDGLKRGSLKRLEYALEPGVELPDLTSALAAAGARAVVLPASFTWSRALIDHLIAQSPTLKPLPDADRTPSVARTAGAAGFTVLEMLLSIVLLTAVISVSASSFESLKRQDGTHEAALEFAALVREARETARRQNTLVRLVLSAPELAPKLTDSQLAAEDLKPGCGVFTFLVPAHRLDPVAFTLPTTAHESDASLRETAPLTRVPLPQNLIGGWTAAPGHGGWHDWPEHIHLGGPLIDDYLQKDFSEFSRSYLFLPASTWAARRPEEDPSRNPFSIHPSAIHHSPYRRSSEPVVAVLSEESDVTLDDGTTLPAREIWGAAPVLQWGAVDPETYPAMPALDFTPEGRLATIQKEHVEIHFRPGPGRQPLYRVFIRSRDGEVHIE